MWGVEVAVWAFDRQRNRFRQRRERGPWIFGGFGHRGRWVAGHLESEGSGKGAQDAAGSGDFGEQGRAFRGGEEDLESRGLAAGFVVVDVAQDPGEAAGEAGCGLGAGGAAGAGFAGFGEGAGAPVGDEFFEALDRAVEMVVDAGEEGIAGGLFGRNDADDDQEAGEDGAEVGGDRVHRANLY